MNFRDSESGATPLMLASQYQDQETVSLMLRKGAKVNARDVRGGTALMRAVFSDKSHVPTVRMLLDHGADPNAANEEGNVPLCFVYGPGRLKYIKLLVQHGATVNKRDKSGRTVIKQMVDNKNTYWPTQNDVIHLLVQIGAHW